MDKVLRLDNFVRRGNAKCLRHADVLKQTCYYWYLYTKYEV